MILPEVRDPRLVTMRRGGSLTDDDHRLLAEWAATCVEHVLPLFASTRPDDDRPRAAIDHVRGWIRGEASMMESRAAAAEGQADADGRAECAWLRAQLPAEVRELVLDEQRRRNDICWSVLDR